MKKIFSVALALIMVLSCVSVMASAITTNAVLEVSLEATQATYNKGDVVTFEVFYEESAETEGLGSPTVIGFGYDSSVFEPIEDLTINKDGLSQITYIVDGYPLSAEYNPASCAVRILAGGSEKDKAKGWDTILHIGMPSKTIYDFTTKKAAFAFQLRIKEDANPNGSYSVGVSDQYHQNEFVNINDPYGGIYGSDTEAFGFENTTMFSFVDATVNVASAEASIITPMSSQIRFQGIGADKDKTNYAGYFDVRTRAKIADDDFVAKFGADGERLADIGFIYASTKDVEDFSMATAQAVAQGTDATGYVKYSCKYVQHTGDGADYIFTCLIADIKDTDANKQDGVNCVAFAQDTDGNYYFYSDVTPVSYGSLYNQYFPA